MKLYSFFNSSASYRVRIALALKGIDYQSVGVNIRIGQQNALEYRRLNPVGLVPTLITDDGESLGQSLAIADWLDRHYLQPLLLPQEDSARMRVLEIVYRLRYSPNKQHARFTLPQRRTEGERRGEKALVCALDPAGIQRRRAAIAPREIRRFLRGRCAHAGRLLSGSAVGQRAENGLRSQPLSALPGGL